MLPKQKTDSVRAPSMTSVLLMNEEKLSGMEAEFIHNFAAIGLTGPKAAAAAGYEAKNAHLQLLKDPKIRYAIAEQYERNNKTLQYSREDIMAGMKEAIELARCGSDPTAMIRGWTEIGKLAGHYQQAPVVTINVLQAKTLDDMKTLTQDELLSLVERAQEAAAAQNIAALPVLTAETVVDVPAPKITKPRAGTVAKTTAKSVAKTTGGDTP